MCLSPNQLYDGTKVACRKCSQCHDLRTDDWVGRCIAESKMSVATYFVTLTYGRVHGMESHERAAILTYSDIIKFMKRLRKRGVSVRFFVTGEVGSDKGRAHWHIILFFKTEMPQSWDDYGLNAWHPDKRETPVSVPFVFDRMVNHPAWPHGMSHWTIIKDGNVKGSLRYACKYINKDVNDPMAQSKLCMSKRPPIGAEYFEGLAQKYVDEGVAPPDGFYMFPNDARQKNGKPVRFRLAGKSAELLCEHFITKWAQQRGGHPPHSEYLDKYLDSKCRDDWKIEAEYQSLVKRVRPEKRWPFLPPFGFQDIDIQYGEHGPYVSTEEGPLWYGPDKKGVKKWSLELPSEIWIEGKRYLRRQAVDRRKPESRISRNRIDPIRNGRVSVPSGNVGTALNGLLQQRASQFSMDNAIVQAAQMENTKQIHAAAFAKTVAAISNMNEPDVTRIRPALPVKGSEQNSVIRGIKSPIQKGVKGVSPLSGSLGQKALPAARSAQPMTKPDRSPDTVREGPTCKPRPTVNRGDGSSKRFVPWCDIKK